MQPLHCQSFRETGNGLMESREGARESRNPAREGEGGNERARESPNPEREGWKADKGLERALSQ